MKVLNLYSGIGGNRLYWHDMTVTAVELNPGIAEIYSDHFPKDKVIVGDAHEYLLKNYDKFDFIWSSPPCPSHSRPRYAVASGTDFNKYPHLQRPIYPEMSLYQEIIFLHHYFEGNWVVENVLSYYKPLIIPQTISGHYYWSNILIPPIKTPHRQHEGGVHNLEMRKGFNLKKYKGIDKRKALRNCVEPEVGQHILNAVKNPIEHQMKLIDI